MNLFFLTGIALSTIIILYIIIYSNIVNRNTVSGLWAKNKPYLIYEVLALIIVVMVYYFLDDNRDISDPTGGGVISKKSSLGDTLDSVLSLDWIPFQLSKHLSAYFNETSTKIILWTLVALAGIWIVKTIYRVIKKQSPVIAFGYSGGWLIFLISALVFYIFIVETFPGDKNEVKFSAKPINIELEFIDQPQITTILASDVIQVKAPMAPSDGNSTTVICAEIIDEWLIGMKGVPNEHLEYSPDHTGTNILRVTKEMRKFMVEKEVPPQVRIQLTARTANYWNIDSGNICPHSTY